MQFHIDHIEPATELEADLLEMSDLFKPEPRVQSDAGGLLSVHAGDDGVVAEAARANNQVLQQKRADAVPLVLVADIKRIFNRVPVSRALVKSRK